MQTGDRLDCIQHVGTNQTQSGHTFGNLRKSAKPLPFSGKGRGKVEGENSVPDLCSLAEEVGKTDDLCLVLAEVAVKSGKKTWTR